MNKYRTIIEFDRLNPVTKKLESSRRYEELYASDEKEARSKALDILKADEKTRRKIKNIKITKLD